MGIQKRCVRLILDANPSDNTVTLFNLLKWIPIDDAIRVRKLCMMYRKINNLCPQYFDNYVSYVRNRHEYRTRASSNMKLVVPKYRTRSGLRCFHAGAARLWNELDMDSTAICWLGNFKKHLIKRILLANESCDHFQVTETY